MPEVFGEKNQRNSMVENTINSEEFIQIARNASQNNIKSYSKEDGSGELLKESDQNPFKQ